MKKEEFPTFLNEQPTVVFGRNMRELMVMLVGIAFSYIVWANISTLIPGADLAILACKILCVIGVLAGTLAVAFIKIASRPLEEWALVGLFYYCTPKIFLYMPFDDDEKPGSFSLSQREESQASVLVDDGFN